MRAETKVLGGRYRIDELIGQGGMADVHRGYDEKLGREVAVKILHRNLASDATFRSRFKLEAQAASRMAHPSIVRVFDAGEDIETDANGATRAVPFIVMELITGTLLKDLVSMGPLKPDEAVRYVDGILEALEYSHRAGVIHRDIKPGNVMITESGQVKVMDFGIARAVSDSASTVAQTTRILGTASYFSPEQAKGEQVDTRTDLYSAGIVLFELLTGRPPFRGDSPVAVAYQHLSETPATPSSVNPAVPRRFDPVVLRALAKDPAQRYSDAARFREALDTASVSNDPTEKEIAALTTELYSAGPRTAQQTVRTLSTLSSDAVSRTQSGPPVAWIWAAVVIIAVLIGAIMIWVVNLKPTEVAPPNSRTISNLSGMTFERAQTELEALDLTANRVDEPSNSVAEGVVIRTDPGADLVVTAGTEVDVFVSEGPEQVSMPELAGLTESEARAAITEAGLAIGSIRPVDDPETEKGRVIAALADGDDVEPGADVANGTRIDLDIATGRVAVVDLTGYSEEEATRQLEEAGLTVERDYVTCDDNSQAGVVEQSAGPGTVEIHSTVTLSFCTDGGIEGDPASGR